MRRPRRGPDGGRRRLLRGDAWRTCGYCGVRRPVGWTRPLCDLRRYRERGEVICERCAAIATDPAIPLPDIRWGAWDHALWLTVARQIKSKSHRLAYWGAEKAAERARDKARIRAWERARRRRLGRVEAEAGERARG